MRSGIVVVDKPAGRTSHDVVGRIRRLAGTRKVGHAGTLDPMATGVLVLGINKATRLLGHLMLADKEYLATIRLGSSTVTDDREGDIISESNALHLSEEQIQAAVSQLTGDIAQVPSSVSAIKVAGRRSYARVRAGEEVELPPRCVHVGRFEIEQLRTQGERKDVDVRVVCSSGTYVRALARDVGASLGVGGHLTRLRRTRVGDFAIDQARTLDELATEFSMLSLDQVGRQCFRVFEADADQSADVRFGRSLPGVDLGAEGPVAVYGPTGEFLALYENVAQVTKPIAVFAASDSA